MFRFLYFGFSVTELKYWCLVADGDERSFGAVAEGGVSGWSWSRGIADEFGVGADLLGRFGSDGGGAAVFGSDVGEGVSGRA